MINFFKVFIQTFEDHCTLNKKADVKSFVLKLLEVIKPNVLINTNILFVKKKRLMFDLFTLVYTLLACHQNNNKVDSNIFKGSQKYTL